MGYLDMTIERNELEQLIDHNWRLWQLPEGDVEGNIGTGLNIAWLKWKETGEIPPLESRIKMNVIGAGGEGCEFDTTPILARIHRRTTSQDGQPTNPGFD